MNEQMAALLVDDSDWSWDFDCSADIKARLERLESGRKLSRFELYEELSELTAHLEVYWCGCAPERQRETAREVREILRKCEALKLRMQTYARSELRNKQSRGERFSIDRWGYIHDAKARA